VSILFVHHVQDNFEKHFLRLISPPNLNRISVRKSPKRNWIWIDSAFVAYSEWHVKSSDMMPYLVKAKMKSLLSWISTHSYTDAKTYTSRKEIP
jgi:hypothetical protein